MRNVIFRGRDNIASLGVEFDGDFELSDLTHVTAEIGGRVYSSETGSLIIEQDSISIDIGSDVDLPDDGAYPVTLIAYSATYPDGYVLTYPCNSLQKLRIKTLGTYTRYIQMVSGVDFDIGWKFSVSGGGSIGIADYSILIELIDARTKSLIDSFDTTSPHVTVDVSQDLVSLKIPPSATSAYNFNLATIDCWIYKLDDTDGIRSKVSTIELDRRGAGT